MSTLQQQMTRAARKFLPSEFLPGIGPFRSSLNARPERMALKEAFSLDLPDESIDTGIEDVEEISPVVVTVSDTSPLAALKLDTFLEEEEEREETACRYLQFTEEQASLSTTSNCTKGGMRCERKCSQSTGSPVCTEEMVSLCEDVPERVCETVMEKHCRTVQEEACDGRDGARAEQCTVEMNEECQDVDQEICTEESKAGVHFLSGRSIEGSFEYHCEEEYEPLL